MTWAQIDDVAVELGRDIASDSTEGRQIGKWLRRAEMMIRNRIPVLDEWCGDATVSYTHLTLPTT